MSAALVIFGARILPDGRPSGTVQRRVEGALAVAQEFHAPLFVPTGGRGDSGHVEADVMQAMLVKAGIPLQRILAEREARDTLQSVQYVSAILRLRAPASAPVIPCTSPYHVARCAALLAALGWPVETRPMPGDAGNLPMRKLLWYHAKEALALPYDLAMLKRERARERG